MVGKTSEQLEPSGCKMLEASLEEETKQKKLEEDISQYLLLHHNYAAKPEPEVKPKLQPRRQHTPKTTIYKKPKVKPIMPKVPEIVYQPYDQTGTNMIIVIDDPEISEAVTEVPYKSGLLNVNSENYLNCGSPTPSNNDASDCGYESLGSPHSFTDDEIWNNNVTELFPTLV